MADARHRAADRAQRTVERELSKTERRDVDRELAAGAQYPERDR